MAVKDGSGPRPVAQSAKRYFLNRLETSSKPWLQTLTLLALLHCCSLLLKLLQLAPAPSFFCLLLLASSFLSCFFLSSSSSASSSPSSSVCSLLSSCSWLSSCTAPHTCWRTTIAPNGLFGSFDGMGRAQGVPLQRSEMWLHGGSSKWSAARTQEDSSRRWRSGERDSNLEGFAMHADTCLCVSNRNTEQLRNHCLGGWEGYDHRHGSICQGHGRFSFCLCCLIGRELPWPCLADGMPLHSSGTLEP